ncbi:N-acetyltransferase family protein [Marivita sp. S6314]|uniref:GNAT family N-acetyltransferase n=1 Tax=Marivita sp. S6314 TaxID=2926406 RepID=UPI001FF5A1CF|nr:GNAT family N-acetyltransferase [Marivita sp. S6314]MCK0148839.1 N-acetyltransferase family protein [Marivita sp. S6314]
MIIRQAKPEDAGAIADIVNEIVDATTITFTTCRKPAQDILADIDARGPAFVVAAEADRVLGFATYFAFRSGPGYAQVKEHSIVLAPPARGWGLGRRLMAHLEDVARAEGVHALIAGVSGENADGIAFHAALGFREVGRLPEVGHKFGRWLDLVLMQKLL